MRFCLKRFHGMLEPTRERVKIYVYVINMWTSGSDVDICIQMQISILNYMLVNFKIFKPDGWSVSQSGTGLEFFC